jgi:DNA-binding Xre family transcriptional regulator
MKLDEVPQDDNVIYRGGRKAVYAQEQDGGYAIAPSSGWNVEEVATLQAVDEFRRLEREAWESFLEHRSSPLEVWMYHRRMTLPTLSQCSGFWQWQVKRHLKEGVFKALDTKKIAIYCEVLDVTLDELYNPKEPE